MKYIRKHINEAVRLPSKGQKTISLSDISNINFPIIKEQIVNVVNDVLLNDFTYEVTIYKGPLRILGTIDESNNNEITYKPFISVINNGSEYIVNIALTICHHEVMFVYYNMPPHTVLLTNEITFLTHIINRIKSKLTKIGISNVTVQYRQAQKLINSKGNYAAIESACNDKEHNNRSVFCYIPIEHLTVSRSTIEYVPCMTPSIYNATDMHMYKLEFDKSEDDTLPKFLEFINNNVDEICTSVEYVLVLSYNSPRLSDVCAVDFDKYDKFKFSGIHLDLEQATDPSFVNKICKVDDPYILFKYSTIAFLCNTPSKMKNPDQLWFEKLTDNAINRHLLQEHMMHANMSTYIGWYTKSHRIFLADEFGKKNFEEFES